MKDKANARIKIGKGRYVSLEEINERGKPRPGERRKWKTWERSTRKRDGENQKGGGRNTRRWRGSENRHIAKVIMINDRLSENHISDTVKRISEG